jgi:hypothetical protein
MVTMYKAITDVQQINHCASQLVRLALFNEYQRKVLRRPMMIEKGMSHQLGIDRILTDSDASKCQRRFQSSL